MIGILRQVGSAALLDQGDKLGVHVGIAVRDVEHDDALSGKVLAETCGETTAMGLLHDEDDVGPTELLG